MVSRERRFVTNLGWVVATVVSISVLAAATTALTWGAIPVRVSFAGFSLLAIAAFLTYVQSLVDA